MLAIIVIATSCEKQETVTPVLNKVKAVQTNYGWEYNFPQGWTIFSLPIEPDAGYNPADVFAEITDDVIIMKTWGLAVEIWWPEQGINNMTLNCQQSYMMKLESPHTIYISGEPTSAEIVMLDGWQMIGYPEQDTANSGMEYYFGWDYEEFDIGKNCNGSKIFWGSQGLDCTVEPGCGFLLHHDDGSCKEVPSPPERMYLDMEGNRIHYGDIEGSAIELTMWDQRIIHMARNYKDY